MDRRFVGIAFAALFLVLFNMGYVFHEPLLGAWFHEQEAAIARDHFIIPLIALAFISYSLILAYLYPIYIAYYGGAPTFSTTLRFMLVMGVLWDGLQGGIIEVATFKMPAAVFFVDSGYHIFVEGIVATVILMWVAKRWPPLPRRK
jgi:uncharacterized membrane protein